jgi:hypothetical protein
LVLQMATVAMASWNTVYLARALGAVPDGTRRLAGTSCSTWLATHQSLRRLSLGRRPSANVQRSISGLDGVPTPSSIGNLLSSSSEHGPKWFRRNDHAQPPPP